MADIIISREEARAQGLKFFFTGLPCVHGHLAPRRVCAGRAQPCVECQADGHRRWYAKNPGQKRLQASRRNLDPEQSKAFNRAYALKHRRQNVERARESARRWYADPANAAARRNARRALKAAGGPSAAARSVRDLLSAQGERCAYCAADFREVKKHLDHIMPLALGGSNGIDNLQWLCAPCNLAKGAKHPDVFAQERADVSM